MLYNGIVKIFYLCRIGFQSLKPHVSLSAAVRIRVCGDGENGWQFVRGVVLGLSGRIIV